jgi:hypothetical protein
MFWHGPPLRRVHRACLASFLAHGHAVVLWAYDELGGVPAGVTLADAGRILPRHSIFRHARTGSLAPFADWFRYRLLLEHGGLWCDVDIVCLEPLDYADDVILGRAPDGWISNAVLGLPAGHPLAARLVEYCEHPNRWQASDPWPIRLRKLKRRLVHGDRKDRMRYGETGPKALTWIAEHLGYAARARPATEFFAVPDAEWRTIFDGRLAAGDPRLAGSRALHLCNEMMRRDPAFDPDARFPGSLYEALCERYLPDERRSAALSA